MAISPESHQSTIVHPSTHQIMQHNQFVTMEQLDYRKGTGMAEIVPE